jgi:hypothetical protein
VGGTSSPDGELTGDLGNVIETAPIGGLRSSSSGEKIIARQLSTFANNIGPFCRFAAVQR